MSVLNYVTAFLFLFIIVISGCDEEKTPPTSSFGTGECKYNESHRTWVVLDWTGRSNNPTNEQFFRDILIPAPGFNFSLFKDYGKPGTPTLSFLGADRFKEIVRQKIAKKFQNIKPNDIHLITGEAEAYPYATKCYILQSTDADARSTGAVGVANVEHGNLRTAEDTAFVLGQEILRLGDKKKPSFDQWANFIANVAAHEIGHTMGWKHTKSWTCTGDCQGENRHPLYDWNLSQESLDLMRSVVGVSYFLFEQDFRVDDQTSQYVGNYPGCTAVEYNVINPFLPFPDHPWFKTTGVFTFENMEMVTCGTEIEDK